jgi:hypothetical protein
VGLSTSSLDENARYLAIKCYSNLEVLQVLQWLLLTGFLPSWDQIPILTNNYQQLPTHDWGNIGGNRYVTAGKFGGKKNRKDGTPYAEK